MISSSMMFMKSLIKINELIQMLRCELLTPPSTLTPLCDVAPRTAVQCSVADTDRSFRGAYCLRNRSNDHGDGSQLLWNVSYLARRQPS